MRPSRRKPKSPAILSEAKSQATLSGAKSCHQRLLYMKRGGMQWGAFVLAGTLPRNRSFDRFSLLCIGCTQTHLGSFGLLHLGGSSRIELLRPS